MDSVVMDEQATGLRFNGSVWCNLDVALRNLDAVFGQRLQALGLTVIEFYIMRALYERDGQHASELARAVGRAATSFTPNLDKLQNKGMVERRADLKDRRAIRIHLTERGIELRGAVQEAAEQLDYYVSNSFPARDFAVFLNVLEQLQRLPECSN